MPKSLSLWSVSKCDDPNVILDLPWCREWAHYSVQFLLLAYAPIFRWGLCQPENIKHQIVSDVQLISYSACKGNVYIIGHFCSKGDTCIGHCLDNTLCFFLTEVSRRNSNLFFLYFFLLQTYFICSHGESNSRSTGCYWGALTTRLEALSQHSMLLAKHLGNICSNTSH
jgi:hypothetical protein